MFFHIKKLYICVSWYFLLMLAWVILTGKMQMFLLCFTALIIHEAGHIIMIYALKEKINIFYILPFGFCCRLKNQNKISDEKMMKILFAGPVTGILVAVLFLWTKEFAIMNFTINIFNLLPLGNLDGGRMIKIVGKRFIK